MRNKGFFWTLTFALVLATIYQLSFTLATNKVEKEAKEVAEDKIDSLKLNEIEYVIDSGDTLYTADEKHHKELVNFFADAYLQQVANQKVHFSGATYSEAQKNEINLGLDLKGGMSVTLEISIPELVHSLAGNTKKSAFYVPYTTALERTNNGEGNFVDLFAEEFEKENPEGQLAKYFHRYNKDDLEPDATNAEVVDFLNLKAGSALDGVETIIEKRVNQFGVAQPTIQKQPATNRIFVELPGVKDKESVRRKIQATASLEFYETYDNAYDGIGQRILMAESVLSQELFGDVIGNNDATDNTDTTLTLETLEEVETTVETEDTTNEELSLGELLTEDSNEATAEETAAESDSLTDNQQRQLRPISSYLQVYASFDQESQQISFIPGPVVGTAAITDTSILNGRLNHPAFIEALGLDDLKLMWGAKQDLSSDGNPTGRVSLYAIKNEEGGAPVTGEDIENSSSEYDVQNGYQVLMRMTANGSGKWGELTGKAVKRYGVAGDGSPVNGCVAITMDNYVFSAPVVREKMNFSASISGSFTMEEAKDLSGLLNAGSLPAPAKIVDENSVGPTLGEANINAGMISFGVAILLVLLYMVFYYGKAGGIADIALIFNIFLLVGALASLRAILTLPGIAGIVLTIGMSVDANVLIFERIREELKTGKGLKASLNEGFNRAMAAILDANITTLLTGVVLLVFGSGPIKGFATTLIIGIFTSFFAAVVISRLIFSALLDKGQTFTFTTNITKKWFQDMNVQFVTKRKIFYAISGLVILAGVISLATRGLDKGVDFTGGRTYTVAFEETVNPNDLRTQLTPVFDNAEPIIKTVGNDYTVAITTKYLVSDNSDEANDKVEAQLKKGLESYSAYEIESSKMIAPTISKDLKANAFSSIIFSLVIIFAYIVFRFRKWQFGLGALLAMAHDVLIVLGIFSITWGWIGFSLEIDQAFIAAILTVVGYSINDTVVVFDRIREYLNLHPKRDRKDIINEALNSTMSRTINTSLSTFIVLLIIFLFGGDSIKGFTFALMVGVIVGTYSSLFIATPTVIDFEAKKADKK